MLELGQALLELMQAKWTQDEPFGARSEGDLRKGRPCGLPWRLQAQDSERRGQECGDASGELFEYVRRVGRGGTPPFLLAATP